MSECCLAGPCAFLFQKKSVIKAGEGNKFVSVNPRGIRVEDVYDVAVSCCGEGGFGAVRKATSRKTGEVCVVKTMMKAAIPDIRLFQCEVDLQAMCDHPHILRLHETFEDRENIYIAMESCEGGTILEKLTGSAGERFKEGQAMHIINSLFRALSYMHGQAHIAHRDLKPENLLLKEVCDDMSEANLKLIDFGFAQRFTPGQNTFSTMLGTPFYMAPEILEGRSAKYNERCDVWSGGVILYLLLSGKLPWFDEDNAKVLELVKVGTLSFDDRAWKGISPSAKLLIVQMCNKQVARRPTAHGVLESTWIKEQRQLEFEREGVADDPESPRSSISPKCIVMTSKNLTASLERYCELGPMSKAALGTIVHMIDDQGIKLLRDTFEALDTSAIGKISLSSLQDACLQSGLPPAKLKPLLAQVKADEDGMICYSTFLALNLQKEQFLQRASCWDAFRVFDRDGNGVLDMGEVHKMLKESNLVSDAEEKDILDKLKKRGLKSVDFDVFMELLEAPKA